MADIEQNGGRSRADLLERVALMEEMIAEGRRTTGRYGWIFVTWGLVYVVATLWATYLPRGGWAWPVCIAIACVVVYAVRRRGVCSPPGSRTRNIQAVWSALGITVTGFVVSTIVAHQAGNPAYVAAIFFFIGMGHGASGMILRWPVQISVAILWWACGAASLFMKSGEHVMWVFLGASVFGMIFFGIYAMAKESQRAKVQREERHA